MKYPGDRKIKQMAKAYADKLANEFIALKTNTINVDDAEADYKAGLTDMLLEIKKLNSKSEISKLSATRKAK